MCWGADCNSTRPLRRQPQSTSNKHCACPAGYRCLAQLSSQSPMASKLVSATKAINSPKAMPDGCPWATPRPAATGLFPASALKCMLSKARRFEPAQLQKVHHIHEDSEIFAPSPRRCEQLLDSSTLSPELAQLVLAAAALPQVLPRPPLVLFVTLEQRAACEASTMLQDVS